MLRARRGSDDLSSTHPGLEQSGLAARLWVATKSLHSQAERSGIIASILRGEASRRGYAMMLRNLLPAYAALELGLDAHSDTPGVHRMVRPETYRSAAIEADLRAIEGDSWRDTLPLLVEGDRYAIAVAQAAEYDGGRLIAHAYTRTLGDLSGGQIMQKMLARSLGFGPEELAFYRFPDIADITAYKAEYRRELDAAGTEVHDAEAVTVEAALAFRLNMAVSDAVTAFLDGVD